MTIFESLALLVATLIVIMLLFFGIVWKLLDDIKGWQKLMCETLSEIRGDTVDIFHELNNIEDNILDDMRDIRLAQEFGRTPPPNAPVIPCYSPDGTCMNPHGDCINCPKRGTGGIWSTNTNKIKED